MSSYGLIPLTGSGALLQVHTLEDSVLAVPLFDPKHGLLNLPLPSVGGLVHLLPLLLGGVIGEQIQLLRLLLGRVSLGEQLVGADAQPADQ